MKKVGFTISYFSPYISGLTIYCRNLAQFLSEHYEVGVLTWQFSKELPLNQIIGRIKVKRIPYLFRISKGFFSLRWIWDSYSFVKANDVIVVNLPQPEALITAVFARIFGKKLIVIFHCLVILPREIDNILIRKAVGLCNFLILLLSHVIVSYSRDFADSVPLLRFFSQKVVFVYPPIREPLIDDQLAEVVRASAQISPETAVIGFAGRIASEKGLEYLIEAFSDVKKQLEAAGKQVKLLIAGPLSPVGEGLYSQKIQSLAAPFLEEIVFLGELPAEKVGSFYKVINVLVLPSTNSTESFGMVQVEAMMCGVPVVASDLPGVRVPIRETGMGRLVPPADALKLAEAIAEVLSEPNLYRREKDFVRGIFSAPKTARFYRDLIDSL